jgi:hypothetical protein
MHADAFGGGNPLTKIVAQKKATIEAMNARSLQNGRLVAGKQQGLAHSYFLSNSSIGCRL